MQQDIQIGGPGVTKYRITEPTSAYGFRYDGLRLLQRTGDKFYLLPVGWRAVRHHRRLATAAPVRAQADVLRQ